jgi:predicted RNase H-like nuclease (RuvC/YqgF family)
VANVRGAKNRGREFWVAAVERMKAGEKAMALAQELGVDVHGLYRWRKRLDPGEQEVRLDPRRQREATLGREVEKLKRALADKVLEVDFLRGALHKIEERRRKSESGGAQASTTRSGK